MEVAGKEFLLYDGGFPVANRQKTRDSQAAVVSAEVSDPLLMPGSGTASDQIHHGRPLRLKQLLDAASRH